eukprot:11966529-Alexandrium_andersonii.AAC.1
MVVPRAWKRCPSFGSPPAMCAGTSSDGCLQPCVASGSFGHSPVSLGRAHDEGQLALEGRREL